MVFNAPYYENKHGNPHFTGLFAKVYVFLSSCSVRGIILGANVLTKLFIAGGIMDFEAQVKAIVKTYC